MHTVGGGSSPPIFGVPYISICCIFFASSVLEAFSMQPWVRAQIVEGGGHPRNYGNDVVVGERRLVDVQASRNCRSKMIEVPVVHHETRVPVEYEVPVEVPVRVPVRVDVPYPVERIVEVPHEVLQERLVPVDVPYEVEVPYPVENIIERCIEKIVEVTEPQDNSSTSVWKINF